MGILISSMEGYELIQLAEQYCEHFHGATFRKGTNEPYSAHPKAVRNILRRNGYSDHVTQCIALLHDIVEDTEVIMRDIKGRFGYEIANGVYLLSKNTLKSDPEQFTAISRTTGVSDSFTQLAIEELYKLRLVFARETVQRVKVADMIQNTKDLESLKPEGIERKIQDAESFYIPMGRKVAPIMVRELEGNIDNYRSKANFTN